MENTYWNHKGTHEDKAKKLQELIPAQGEVSKPWKNKALERFRKASNAYYDIFNNGGWNRGKSIGKFFPEVMWCLKNQVHNRGGSPMMRKRGWENIYLITEPVMDQIVLDAYAEQFGIEEEA